MEKKKQGAEGSKHDKKSVKAFLSVLYSWTHTQTHANAPTHPYTYHAAGFGGGKVVWVGAVGAFSRDGRETPPNELLIAVWCPLWWLVVMDSSFSRREKQ